MNAKFFDTLESRTLLSGTFYHEEPSSQLVDATPVITVSVDIPWSNQTELDSGQLTPKAEYPKQPTSAEVKNGNQTQLDSNGARPRGNFANLPISNQIATE